ncbi:hypothetical protein ACOMHN_026174 [Nucella lapillus]
MNNNSSNRSNSSDLDQDLDQDLDRATQAINAFLPWILILFGTVFNILIILGMRTKNFRALSTSVFMIVGATNDVISLPVLLFAHWLHLNFPEAYERGSGGDFLCKFFSFYGWGQADFGIMLLSAMTADRAYVILRPMTTVDLMKRAKIVTGICIGVVTAKEFHFWFSAGILHEARKDRLCDVANISVSYNEFYQHYWPWVDFVFVTLCFVVMVVSNLILILYVRKKRKGRELTPGEVTVGSQNGESARRSSTMSIHAGSSYNSVSTQVTKMLLGESLALFLLSYPFSIHLMVTSQIHDLHDDPAKAKVNALAFNIVFYLLYANKCVNFLVYLRAGKKFRKAIVEEVLCRFRCGKVLFGRVMKTSDSGDGSFQGSGQQQSQSQTSRTGLRPLWKNVPTVSCVSCRPTVTET